MTKKKTTKKEPVQQYVILKPIMYKVMIPEEYEFINPAEDPYAPDARRITLEHLSKADINRVLMRRIVAEDVPQPTKEGTGE